jgi:hypothetical protein
MCSIAELNEIIIWNNNFLLFLLFLVDFLIERLADLDQISRVFGPLQCQDGQFESFEEMRREIALSLEILLLVLGVCRKTPYALFL